MVIVTGASGFIGKNFVLTFTEIERVRILVRKTSNISLFKQKKNIEIAYGNLETGAGLDQALAGIDIVVHCAARTFGRNYRDFFRTNTLGTYHLLRAMEKNSCKRLLFLSSHAAAGPCVDCNPIDETCPTRPDSKYGLTKKLAEDAINKGSINYTILRPCSVYGPYDVEVLKYIKLLNKGLCPVIGRGEKYVNLVYVGDLVNLMLAVIRKNHFNGKTYFVCDGKTYSYSEVFAHISKVLNRKKITKIHVPLSIAKFFGLLNEVFLPERKRIIDRDKINVMAEDSWLCSNAKVVNALGFKPEYTLATGMEKTIKWYRDNSYLK